jgi:hypothetical protein
VPLCGIIAVSLNSYECESMFVVPLKISWEFRRKCASNVLAILLMVFNYVSNHTESRRGLQTKNEPGAESLVPMVPRSTLPAGTCEPLLGERALLKKIWYRSC